MGEHRYIAGWSLESIILDDLADSFLIDPDDGESEGHGFDDGNPLSLGCGSCEEELGADK